MQSLLDEGPICGPSMSTNLNEYKALWALDEAALYVFEDLSPDGESLEDVLARLLAGRPYYGDDWRGVARVRIEIEWLDSDPPEAPRAPA